MVLLGLVLPAYGANVSEYAVKAAYLSDFAKLVKWPKAAFAEEDSPILVGVLGADPFGSTLDEAIKSKTVAGRSLAVKRFGGYDKGRLEELKGCHILFISESEKDNIKQILSDLRGAHSLTVSEIDQFPMEGGVIEFAQEGDVIGLVINPKTARIAGLILKSELTKDAKLYMKVDSDKEKKLYYDGVQLYINGQVQEAIQKWQECLDEDPQNTVVQKDIRKAKAKLRALLKIKQ